MMKERLPVQTVERLHRLLAGDAGLEDTILTFIAGRYGARSLIYLPARVAEQVLKRPATLRAGVGVLDTNHGNIREWEGLNTWI
jgi:hypothetical protein